MDQRRRILILVGVLCLLTFALGVQAVVIDRDVQATTYGEPYPGNTLISVHSWDDDGALVEVNPEGEVVWHWTLENSRVFGAEHVADDRVLVAVGVVIEARDCPEEHTTHEDFSQWQDHCVLNRVIELDKESQEPVWEYSWYDDFIHWHEVHDVERLDNGETAVIDMGQNRVFTVNRSGEITWEWQAEPHLDEGSPFFEEHVPDHLKEDLRKKGPRDDWTHMNDIAQLENGNFQMSIRNYDVIIEVDPETDEIVDFVGEPGNHEIMNHQHNPHRLEAHGTMLVADSENNRIIELDLETEEIIWQYTGPAGDQLQWPRDGSRLPNGNTLITDSRNNRVLEIDPQGELVWEFHDPDGELIPLPYEADRIGANELPDAPPGYELDTIAEDPGAVGLVEEASTLAHWVLPTWMHLPQQLNLLAIVLTGLWLTGEVGLFGWRQYRS